MWNILRQRGMMSWYPVDWVIETISDISGLSRSNVRKTIHAGVELGLFVYGHPRGIKAIHIVGKEKVYQRYLDGLPPGKIVSIESDELMTDSYQQLRAVYHHYFDVKPSCTRSREVQAKTSGFTEQTTRNWTRRLKEQGKIFVLANHKTAVLPHTGKRVVLKEQYPNTYINTGLYHYDNSSNPKQSWDDNSKRDYIPTKTIDTRNKRMYFYEKDSAEAAYNHRLKKANRDEHFAIVDTFYPDTFIDDNGRKYNTLKRTRPITKEELPADLVMADRLEHMAKRLADIQKADKEEHLAEVGMRAYNLVNTKLKKPSRKQYVKPEQFMPLSNLSEVQQIELMLNPELAVLL